jgi:hypothetical protein
MIRKNDLLEIYTEIKNFGISHTVVFDDETSLVAHGVMDNKVVAGVDVSATLFNRIAEATGNIVRTSQGRRYLQYSHEVIIREGTHCGVEMKDGVHVYPFKNIKTRLEIMGDRRDLRLPEVKAAGKEVKVQKVVKTFDNLTEEQAAFEARCKTADWYYSYSDDAGVYRRGRAQCEGLKKEAEEHGGIHLDIYKYYSSR